MARSVSEQPPGLPAEMETDLILRQTRDPPHRKNAIFVSLLFTFETEQEAEGGLNKGNAHLDWLKRLIVSF